MIYPIRKVCLRAVPKISKVIVVSNMVKTKFPQPNIIKAYIVFQLLYSPSEYGKGECHKATRPNEVAVAISAPKPFANSGL